MAAPKKYQRDRGCKMSLWLQLPQELKDEISGHLTDLYFHDLVVSRLMEKKLRSAQELSQITAATLSEANKALDADEEELTHRRIETEMSEADIDAAAEHLNTQRGRLVELEMDCKVARGDVLRLKVKLANFKDEPVILGRHEADEWQVSAQAIEALKALRWFNRKLKAQAENEFFSENKFQLYSTYTKRANRRTRGQCLKYILQQVDSIAVFFRPAGFEHLIEVQGHLYKDKEGKWCGMAENRITYIDRDDSVRKWRYERREWARIYRHFHMSRFTWCYTRALRGKQRNSGLLFEDLSKIRKELDTEAAEVIEEYAVDDYDNVMYAEPGRGMRCCGCEGWSCCRCARSNCIY